MIFKNKKFNKYNKKFLRNLFKNQSLLSMPEYLPAIVNQIIKNKNHFRKINM